MATTATAQTTVAIPRVAITYCTQCKWMLRAAYFAQELMSTFGTDIGEVALIPATGGIFTVYLTYKPDAGAETQQVLLWDRKAENGFPETKILKQRVRNHIQPEKNLGHSDTPSSQGKTGAAEHAEHAAQGTGIPAAAAKDSLVQDAPALECQDCK